MSTRENRKHAGTGDAASDATPYGPDRLPWKHHLPEMARTKDGYLVSPPQADPAEVYRHAKVPEVQQRLLQVPPSALSERERQTALDAVRAYEQRENTTFLGYQVETRLQDNGYEDLKFFLNQHLNNVGDPFVAGNLGMNTKFVERMVLDYYASLWNANWPCYFYQESQEKPGHPDSYWGYVLTMGSTEGNLDAVLQGRDYLAGKPLYLSFEQAQHDDAGDATTTADNPNAFSPVAVFSSESHYSIVKAVHAMAVPTIAEIGNEHYPGQCPITDDGHWPKSVPTNAGTTEWPIGNGEIDIDKLAKVVDFLAGKGHPILLVLNYGTTFKGAYDRVDEIGDRLLPIFRKHGLDERVVCNDFTVHENGRAERRSVCHKRAGYWIHVDAALGGSYMPFIEMAHNAGQFHSKGPAFDFRLPFVHSVVMSGHKWPGAPWPTGIYMTKRKLLIHPPDHPEYIGSPDTTYAGSRNGFSALILWYFIATRSYEDQAHKAVRCQEVAEYAQKRFRELADELGIDLYVQRSPLSVCVLFRKPNEDIVFDYSLSTKTVPIPGKTDTFRQYGHFFTMNDVDEKLVDSLVERLRQPGAFPDRETVGPGEAYDHSF